jgi:hypothetical protein
MRQLALALLTVSLCSCGENSTAVDMGMDLSMPDLITGDLTIPPDFAGVSCGAMTCGPGEECCGMVSGSQLSAHCVPTGTCTPDGGGSAIQCDGPEDCPGTMPPTGGCCATISGSIGNADAGTGQMGAGGSMCGTCAGSITFDNSTGEFSVQTKLCHAAADCTNFTGSVAGFGNLKFDRCCTAAQAGAYNFCLSSLVAGQTMGAITCD